MYPPAAYPGMNSSPDCTLPASPLPAALLDADATSSMEPEALVATDAPVPNQPPGAPGLALGIGFEEMGSAPAPLPAAVPSGRATPVALEPDGSIPPPGNPRPPGPVAMPKPPPPRPAPSGPPIPMPLVPPGP